MAEDTIMQYDGFEEPKSNFTRVPNDFLEAMHLIDTVGEMKVVYYILRHTWGFQDDQKKITLDEFEHGRKRRDGTRLDGGTGLSKPTIIDGLKRAEQHGFIIVSKDDSDGGRVKKFYSLKMRKESLPTCKETLQENAGNGKEILHRTEKDTTTKKDTIEKDKPEPKPDILDAMLHYGNREQPENWSVPAAAGGADDWGAAVDAFAGLLSLEPATLPGTTRREWSRVLQKVGNRWKTGPSTVAHVIEQIPESQFHWKTYAGPHSAEQDIGVLIGQFQGGGIQKPKKTSGSNGENRHDRNKRIIERARAKYLLPEDTIDAESITIL